MSVGYRPEIDGLRAIAVLGVLIYHAELMFDGRRLLSAGFLGVDVFFVISGFLITRILITEVGEGRFSLLNFYERRARRILPVLFVVIVCTMPFAWWLMLPPALEDYAGSVFTSVLYTSNFWFWSSDSYWGQASALKPLLHTWSLSVEEQFYLLAPWLVILLARRTKLLEAVMIVLLLGSFAIAEIWSRGAPESAFYLLPARAWELLVGGILAAWILRVKLHVSQRVKEMVSAVGLMMVVLPMMLLDSQMRHPSFLTLIPVIGTALVIFASQSTHVGRCLSLKPVVWLGLLSYSIYLWHFPVFSYFKVALIELSMLQKLFCILASLVLATGSYWLIEKPFRKPAVVGRRSLVFSLIAASTVMLSVSAWAYVQKGLPKRFDDFSNVISYLRYPYEESFLSHTCFLHPEELKAKTGFENCAYNKLTSENQPTLYLWGDSNAAHLIPGIRASFEKSHNIYIKTISGCGVFMTTHIPRRPGCKDFNAESLLEIVDSKPDQLIIAGLWKPEFVDQLRVTLSKLKRGGVGNVLVVGPVPSWTPSLPAAILDYQKRHQSIRQFPRYLTDTTQPHVQSIDRRMAAMVAEVGYQYYSPFQQLCQQGEGCLTNVDGDLVQWDYGHLTDTGSVEVVKGLADALDR